MGLCQGAGPSVGVLLANLRRDWRSYSGYDWQRSRAGVRVDADLVLIHGFWSSPATWDRLISRMRDDPDLAGQRIHAFGYESPKLRWPGSPVRVPDYDDIAQSLPAYLAAHAHATTSIGVVTHSQGGLILQRFLAWMLTEGRGRELARLRLAVMLSCPNEGSEYLRSIRAATGFSHHPQAGQLDILSREVGEARRIVLRQVVNATAIDERHCPIPVHVYSGRSDNVVRRESAQSVFPSAEVLPGNHFSILDPEAPGNLTAPTLRRHFLETLTVCIPSDRTAEAVKHLLRTDVPASPARPGQPGKPARPGSPATENSADTVQASPLSLPAADQRPTGQAWIVEVSSDTYQEEVVRRSFKVPVLVEMWDESRGPSGRPNPSLERLAMDSAGMWVLAKINTDVSARLQAPLRAQRVPTVAAMIRGQIVDGFSGSNLTEAELRRWIDRVLRIARRLGL
jgi:pimeloyl-ACP methyl ester carboxylesterase